MTKLNRKLTGNETDNIADRKTNSKKKNALKKM